MLSFPSKEVPGELSTSNLEMQKECCYDSIKIKSIPESYSKLLIDYIPIAKELYFSLSNTNFSEININILKKIR